MYKKGETRTLISLILVLGSVMFSFMLLNIGDRFIDDDLVYSKYHLIETGYILETMLASPSQISLVYKFNLHEYNFRLDEGVYYVSIRGFESENYDFTVDRNLKIYLGPFSDINYFERTSKLIFSNEIPSKNQFLCPAVDTKINNPIITLVLLNNNLSHQATLDKFYNLLSNQLSYTVYRSNNYQNIPNSNLTISLIDEKIDQDIIIYYNATLKNTKFVCILANTIYSKTQNINLAVVPNNNLQTDLLLEINFESNNVDRELIYLISALTHSSRDFFENN